MTVAHLSVADGVSVASAVALALAALLAWLTFRLSVAEHDEARDERRRAPRRNFLDDVYRELKYLAAATEKLNPAGALISEAVVGQQKRLRIALAFLPHGELPLTRALAIARAPDVADGIAGAAAEVAQALTDA